MNYFICGRLREKEIESVLTHLVSFLYIILCIFAVAPHAGAWIEIFLNSFIAIVRFLSHPTRVRGLKLQIPLFPGIPFDVAPHAGAWIEIL